MDVFLEDIKRCSTIEEASKLLFLQLGKHVSETTRLALDLAITSHEGQLRKSGEPYVVHPILVAAITAFISNDEVMVQAALLHDVIEDTDTTKDDIQNKFSSDVVNLVEGLTKIVMLRDEELVASGSNEKLISSAMSFRKMLIASIGDVRVLVIKLCDRLHNMMTIAALPQEKQERIAQETLVVYAPIAHRLGIAKIKNILEDMSFKIIYPKDFYTINEYLATNNQNLQLTLNSFIEKTKKVLSQYGLYKKSYEVFGRVKHNYSIYIKMHRKGIDIDEVLDLIAIRIIVDDPIECYKILGAMHISFTPLITRFKDYISLPKENGYQTIHTSIFYDNNIIEVQIRTKDMHKLAEFGVAAHWKYKSMDANVKLDWLEGLQYQNDSLEEFYELAKGELFSEDISVFSPKGDLFTLPKGSVALDFAYAIHSHIGAKAIGASINKQKSSLLTPLKNGDIIRVITSEESNYHCSWLDSVKTSRAKDGIKTLCKARLKECDMISSYNILSALFDLPVAYLQDIVDEMGGAKTIYRASSYLDFLKDKMGKISYFLGLHEVRPWEIFKKGYKKPSLKTIELFNFFTNKSVDDVVFDYCCHPKVNDEIVAFYDNQKAIIHHKLCKKAHKMMVDEHPMIFVQWKNSKLSRYRLIISLQNQKGVLASLLVYLSKLNLNVTSIDLGIHVSDKAEYCKIEVESFESKKANIKAKISQEFKLIEITNLDDAYNK